MADILLPKKALSVNPLKASQPIGAALAFLGLERSMPLEHGARGCASFNRLFFMRHFREPIALQTTAMEQVATVLGADSNLIEALATVCAKNQPRVIGLISTGLSELQGTDLPGTLTAFRAAYPQHDDVAVIPVNATDTLGNQETGFARAVEAIITALVPHATEQVRRPQQVNVLTGGTLTPGDVEALKSWIEAFGLSPIVLPDLADSLDGHLIDAGFSTLTYGGTSTSAVARMGQSVATLVVGRSLDRTADVLQARTGVPDYRFDSLLGLEACDAFTRTLAEISGVLVPRTIERQRSQLLDAMVDCQFQLGGARAAIAGDADLVSAFTTFFSSMGLDVVAVVASAKAAQLAQLPVSSVVVGDLEDLEWLAREHGAELLVTNSHGTEVAKRLGVTLLRAGFPVYDEYGAHARAFIGYAGTRELIFQVANLLAGHYQELQPYRSRYWDGTPRAAEDSENSRAEDSLCHK
jgi:nitrogenase molybdenum-iron protein NifN